MPGVAPHVHIDLEHYGAVVYGQNALFHHAGVKVVNHFCGGLMPMLDLVVERGADGLETMTPPSMGGEWDQREASRRPGDKLFFIGGFDQNAGFERGTGSVRDVEDETRRNVRILSKDSGYVFCNIHNILAEITPDKVIAMYRAAGASTEA